MSRLDTIFCYLCPRGTTRLEYSRAPYAAHTDMSNLSLNGLVFKSGPSELGPVNGVVPTQGKVRDILFASGDKMPSVERRVVCVLLGHCPIRN